MTPAKLTPEQIDKEKADKGTAKNVDENTIVIEGSYTPDKLEEIAPRTQQKEKAELAQPTPVDSSAPKESARQYAKKVGDYKRVVQMAKEKGVDLDNMDQMPLMDSDKDKITEAVKSAYGRELANGIQGISDSITAPKNEERSKIDIKAQMALEKKKRRAKLADAFYAFGEGLQGKTANPETFASTRLQRKQDEQFQNFKDVTERNQKAKYIFENQTRKELIDWADEQAKNESLDAREREKFKMLADQMKQKNEQFDRKLKQDKEIADAKIKAIGKKGKLAKEDRPVIVKTAQKTYELKPEEAEFYKREVLKNSEEYRSKYPGLFEMVQEPDKIGDNGEIVKGRTSYKINPRIKDTDIISAYIEENMEGGQPITEENQQSYFDKYRKQRGLPTSDVPVSETTKPGTVQQPKAQSQKQTEKADPLGLFSVKDAPRTQTIQKSQYSTGGLY